MGGNNSSEFDQTKLFNQWERKEGFSLNSVTVWKNKLQPTIQIEEHPIFADNEANVSKQRKLFQLRKNSPDLVAAFFLKETDKGGLCSTSVQGRLFLERTPLKLQVLQHIPFPDALHLFLNALSGYKKLYQVEGPFRPQCSQVGFNNAGQAKMWLSNDFSAIFPAVKEVSEIAMVRNLLQMIQEATDNTTTPRQSPSIFNWVYRNGNEVSFGQALAYIKEYSNIYAKGLIPRNLACIQRVGIQKISSVLSINNEQTLSNGSLQKKPVAVSTASQQRISLIPASSTLNKQQLPIRTQIYEQNNQFAFSNVNPVSTPKFFPTGFKIGQTNQAYQIGKAVQAFQPTFVAQTPNGLVTSGVRGSKVNFINTHLPGNNFQQNLSHHEPAVRPFPQVIAKSPSSQKVLEQVVRSPAINRQVVDINTAEVQAKNPVQIQNIAQQTPEITQQNSIENAQKQKIHPDFQQNIQNQSQRIVEVQIPAENPSTSAVKPKTVVQKESRFNLFNSTEISEAPTLSQNFQAEPKQNAEELSKKTAKGNSNFIEDFNPGSRNFIDSSTINIGVEKGASRQYDSYEPIPKSFNAALNSTSNLYKQVKINDGKSSEALLAELKSFSSSKKNIEALSSPYEYSSNSYHNSKYLQKYNQKSSQKPLYNYQGISSVDQTASFYPQSLSNEISKRGLEENIQMKSSMAKNLYDQPQTTVYKFESIQNVRVRKDALEENQKNESNQDFQNYQQEGQYNVEYDPQIFADIQKLKG